MSGLPDPAPTGSSAPLGGQPPPRAFSLETHMADKSTRVFQYNNQRLVSILGRETFPGGRVYKLPTKVIESASRQPLTSSLLPCRIGYYPNADGQRVSRPAGDWAFTLLFCLDGFGTLKLGDKTHRMRRGMIALLRPFEFHAYEADPVQPWSFYWLHFNGTLAQQYYELLTGSGVNTLIEIKPDVAFIQSFEKILNVYQEGHAYKMLVLAAGTMHQLLADLYGMMYCTAAEQETPETRIDRTLEVMRNNLGMHVSIQELAAMANMSHPYFSLQFRRRTGRSPRTYFNLLKLRRACEHLENTTDKVEKIARLVGYEDPFYFCRLFKQVVGCTPTEFRREPELPAALQALADPPPRGARPSRTRKR